MNLIFPEKKSLYAQEQDREDVQKTRKEFINFMSELDVNDLIVLDESGFPLNLCQPYARCKKGDRIKLPSALHAKNISSIAALNIKGIVDIALIEGAVDQPCVESFIKNLLPKLRKGNILIIDNAPVHNLERIKKNILQPIGVKILPLPKYSPDLSPIELFWSKFKNIIRKISPKTLGDLYNSFVEAIECCEEEDFYGWFEHCGYNV